MDTEFKRLAQKVQDEEGLICHLNQRSLHKPLLQNDVHRNHKYVDISV